MKLGSLRIYLLYLPLVALPSFLLRLPKVPLNVLDILLSLAILVWAPLTIRRLRHSQLFVPGILFIIAGLLSVLIATDHSLALGAYKSWIVLPTVYGWTLAVNSVQFTTAIRCLIPQMTLASLWGLWILHTGTYNRLQSWYDSPNFFAMASAPILILACADLYNSHIARSRQILYMFALAIIAIAFFATASIGGIIGITIGIIAYWFMQKQWYTLAKSLVVFLIIVLVALPFITPLNTHGSALAGRSESAKARSQIWDAGRILLAKHPLTGLGLRGFAPAYEGVIGQITPLPVVHQPPEPHNLFLAVWLNLGLLGLFSFVWLLSISTKRLFDIKTWQAVALFAVIVTLLGHGLIDSTFFNNDLAVLFWLILSLASAQNTTTGVC